MSLMTFTVIAAEPKLLGDRYVIDVRTHEEWQADHVEGAELVPVNEIASRIEGIIADKKAPIALYCGSGRRAENALKLLQEKGYSNVVNYGGLEEAKQKVEASKQSPNPEVTPVKEQVKPL